MVDRAQPHKKQRPKYIPPDFSSCPRRRELLTDDRQKVLALIGCKRRICECIACREDASDRLWKCILAGHRWRPFHLRGMVRPPKGISHLQSYRFMVSLRETLTKWVQRHPGQYFDGFWVSDLHGHSSLHWNFIGRGSPAAVLKYKSLLRDRRKQGWYGTCPEFKEFIPQSAYQCGRLHQHEMRIPKLTSRNCTLKIGTPLQVSSRNWLFQLLIEDRRLNKAVHRKSPKVLELQKSWPSYYTVV